MTRPDARTIGVILGALFGLAALDFVGGFAVISSAAVPMAADIVVIGCVVAALRWPLLAALAACAASMWISATAADHLSDWVVVMGYQGAFPGLAELAGICFLVCWCGRVYPRWQALPAWAGLAGALYAVVAWRNRGDHTAALGLIALGGFVAVVVLCEYLRSTDRMHARQADQVRVDERAAIARELHDLVAHHVTGIVLQAQAAQLVAGSSPTAATDALAMIEQSGADALRSMRAIVGSLRSTESAPLEPTATVEDLLAVGAPAHPGDVPVHVRVDGDLRALPDSVVASLHRVALEAVTNARRYGKGATRIDVEIVCGRRQVDLGVSNDGTTAATRNPAGFGLVGIAERIAALGGTVTTGPRPHGGWLVHAVIPS